jgi:hypothetical protein
VDREHAFHLRDRFDVVLEALESEGEWVTNRVEITPDAPVSSWPTEGVQAALERGDLEHWRRIVAEVNRDPWGRTARQLEEVLSHSRPSRIGTSPSRLSTYATGKATPSASLMVRMRRVAAQGE